MMRQKRAVFFTILALVFVQVFLLSYHLQEPSSINDIQHVRSRVDMLNQFIDNMEDDAQRALFISGSRAMVSLNNYVINRKDPVNVSQRYPSVIYSGTVRNDTIHPLMENQTLRLWEQRLQLLADRWGVDLDAAVENFTIGHSTPWRLRTAMDLNYNITDARSNTRFTRHTRIRTSFVLEEWFDPLYSLHVAGSQPIIQTRYNTVNSSSLLHIMNNRTFMASPEAPSFLMRMNNNTGRSPYGIERPLNLTTLGLNNPENRSCMDYQFWNASYSGAHWVQNVSTQTGFDFRLDTAHCSIYNVTCS